MTEIEKALDALDFVVGAIGPPHSLGYLQARQDIVELFASVAQSSEARGYERAREVLRKCEWINGRCPACGVQWGPAAWQRVHSSDCELGRALRASPAPTTAPAQDADTFHRCVCGRDTYFSPPDGGLFHSDDGTPAVCAPTPPVPTEGTLFDESTRKGPIVTCDRHPGQHVFVPPVRGADHCIEAVSAWPLDPPSPAKEPHDP